MAKNFIDQDDHDHGLTFSDGFRFGFGFIIAMLLCASILGGLTLLVAYATHQLR